MERSASRQPAAPPASDRRMDVVDGGRQNARFAHVNLVYVGPWELRRVLSDFTRTHCPIPRIATSAPGVGRRRVGLRRIRLARRAVCARRGFGPVSMGDFSKALQAIPGGRSTWAPREQRGAAEGGMGTGLSRVVVTRSELDPAVLAQGSAQQVVREVFFAVSRTPASPSRSRTGKSNRAVVATSAGVVRRDAVAGEMLRTP